MEGLAARLRAAASALGETREIEATWLRGAADLVERAEPERRAVRGDAVWLEELGPEARSGKAALLSAWVDAAEALRAAIHLHESERGPLVEALFPEWRGPSLRRHADQALAAEAELQRRLASGYVVRRLAELATHAALGTALETLAAAGAVWAAARDRPSLAGAEADEVRGRLLATAEETARVLERVRWVVRAALVHRPDLLDTMFPKRARAAGSSGAPDFPQTSGTPGPVAQDVSGKAAADPDAPPADPRSTAADATPAPDAALAPVPGAGTRRAPGLRRPARPGARPHAAPAAPAAEVSAPRGAPASASRATPRRATSRPPSSPRRPTGGGPRGRSRRQRRS